MTSHFSSQHRHLRSASSQPAASSQQGGASQPAASPQQGGASSAQTIGAHASRLSRRSFLNASALAGAGIVGTGYAMGRASALGSGGSFGSSIGSSIGSSTGLIPDRPQLTHGVAAGDVRPDGGLIWSRSDRPARMIVETSTDPTFRRVRRFESPELMTPATDGTGRIRLVGMEPGQRVHYRVMAEDTETGVLSAPEIGSFVTAPTAHRNIRLHWSGDVAGQGYGINPDIGGMFAFATMAARNPDLFIHSGDTCYADGPISAVQTLDDGRTYRNIETEAKSKVAETLAEFRGQYAYNLLDANYRAFNASVAQVVQWDDHETVNNWYPGEVLDNDKYTVKDVDTLAQRAFQAFHEWQPLDRSAAVDGRIYRKISYGPLLDIFVLDMRSYKDANPLARTAAQAPGEILGAAQTEWLIREVKASTATWKIIANDLPLGIVVPDGEDQEGVSNGRPGPATGREAEIGRVLSGIKSVRNVVWLTADVHYTAAHHYSPDRAAFQDFSPFWEFVTGPLNAGAFGPNKMDNTFGPSVEFSHHPPEDQQNASPLDDFQHFGEVNIDAATRALSVSLFTTRGTELWSTTIEAQ